ncbi:aminodeoxychorismate lyase [Clostridia bacterium]|nr:aminodeoxychorismate lyase [Clostridia bacterium]
MRADRHTANARSPGKRAGIVIIIIIAVCAVIAAGLLFYFQNQLKPVEPGNDTAVAVEIPEGSGTRSVGNILESSGLIGDVNVFRLKSRLDNYDGKFKAGAYELSKSMSMEEIMAELTKGGKAKSKRFTIPEGLRVTEVRDKLAKEGFVDEDRFMDVVKSGDFSKYTFLEQSPEIGDRLEGYLYPETYDILENAAEYDVIDRMLSQFDKLFKPEYYSRADELDLTINDVVTIASLIERETKSAEERALVASVIYNRLDKGMKLGIDATVQFALGAQKDRLYYSDLEVDSPYNTYKIDGLPPAPICSPRMECIEAALYPADTDYLYYVLKPQLDGTHNFAVTSKEFEKFKAEYLKAL